jgi:hypothetical protein
VMKCDQAAVGKIRGVQHSFDYRVRVGRGLRHLN